MSAKKVNPELAAVEAALGSLRPSPTGVDRDRMMYLAGQASAARSRTSPGRVMLSTATAATALVGFALGAMLFSGGERIVYREKPPAKAPVVAPSDVEPDSDAQPLRTDYLEVRRLVLTEGAEAWTSDRPASASDTPTLRWRFGPPDAIESLLDG